jgi:glutathione S-transferase
VWLLLELKQVPYTIEKINMRCYGEKAASFTAKVPRGLLPVMELDGELMTESDAIMAALQDAFPERPMLPAHGTPERQCALLLHCTCA